MKQVIFGLSKAPVFSKGAPNEKATTQQLVHTFQRKNTSVQPPQIYDELPELVRRMIAGDKDAERQYKAIKETLPYCIPGGHCPTGHSEQALEFNGVVQVDIDLKHLNGDTEALALLDRVKQIQPESVLLAAISPSGYGLKILCQTDCEDKTRYKEIELVVRQHYAALLEIPLERIDKLSAAQPCFIPFERPEAPIYENCDPQPLHIPLKQKKQQPTEPAGDCPHDLALAACEYLLETGTSVATCYDEYVKIVAAFKNQFGADGEEMCFNLLYNSQEFRQSTTFAPKFEQKYRRDIKERVNGRRATGWFMVSLAKKAGWKPNSTPKNTTRLKSDSGEKMLDTLKRCEATHLVFGAFITAPTGHGKTTAICKLVEMYQDRKIILVVPNTAILEQAKHDHPGAAVFYGKSKKLPNEARLIVTTGASFMKLCGVINPAEYDVFLDEAHQLAADSSRAYRLDQMREFIEMRPLCRSVSYMTGTPLYLNSPIFKDIPRLEIIQPDILVPRYVSFYTTEKTLFAGAEAAKRSADKGRRAIILINDKTLKLDTLKALLKERNLAILNADTKETPEFKQITQQGEIPKETRYIITTSVITTGNSIYDSGEFDIILLGNFHSSTIAQISARPRNAKRVNIQVIRSTNRTDRAGIFNPAETAKIYREKAQRACNELNNKPDEHNLSAVLCHERQIRKAIQNDPIKQDTNGRWQVCELELMNMVYQDETLAESASDELLAKNLKKYGIIIERETRREYNGELTEYIPAEKIKPTEAQQKEIGKYINAQKEARRLAYQTKLTELEQAIDPDKVIREAQNAGKAPQVYKWAQALVGKYRLSYTDAVQALRIVDNSGLAFGLLCDRLAVQSLEANTEYMDINTMQGILIKAIRSAIPCGTIATADKLRWALAKLWRLDKSIRREEWEPKEPEDVTKMNRKALRFLRMFFDVEKVGRPGKHDARHRKHEYILKEIKRFSDAPTPKIPPAVFEATLAEYISPAPPSYDSRPLPVTSETCPF